MRLPRTEISMGRAQSTPGFLGRALDLIEFDPRFSPALEVLLGRVLMCEGLDDALRVSRAADGWSRIVTLSGELVSPTGAMTGGYRQQKGGSLLGRKTEIAELKKRLLAQSRREHESGEALEAARKSAADAQTRAEQDHRRIAAAQLALRSVEQERDRIARETRRGDDQLAAVRRRTEQIGTALAQIKSAIAVHASELAEAQLASVETQQGAEQERDNLGVLAAELETVRAGLTQERISVAGLTERATGLERSLRSAQEDADRVDAQIRRRREQYDQAQQDLGQLQAAARQRDETHEAAERALGNESSLLEDAQAARNELQSSVHEAAADVRGLSEARANALEAIRKHELREQRSDMQTALAAQRLLEEYDTPAEFALSLDRNPDAPKDTPREVARIRRELRAMGDVNTGAAEEYERLVERRQFLMSQKLDSEEAKAKLSAAISEIDESTRDVFMGSFTAVGKAFEEIFRRLFNGGETQLILTKPDDLLETGVEIIVQTPGKKKQNLMLLSGGERALTAVALLFAFLEVRPAPFCVLDEVDAPLDGVNVERFADLLRDFGNRTQFLVITHNPSTMEAAPIWYGITMSEPGVSRILSLEVPGIR
jgi:chromosome segregation protein